MSPGSFICNTQNVFKIVMFCYPLDTYRLQLTECQLHDIFILQVPSSPTVAGPVNRPTQCTLINRSNSVTTLLLRVLKATYKQSNNDLDSRAVFVPFNFQNSHDRQTHMSSQYYCQAFPAVVGTFMLTTLKIFWDMTLYELENIYRCYG